MSRHLSAFVSGRALSMLLGAMLAGEASAETRTVRFNMPSNLGVFGLVWQGDYAEPSFDGTISAARLMVNFNTQTGVRPFHNAADILFQHQLATSSLPFWNVSGSDLGWSGTGTFTGTLSTHAFDGQPLINAGTLVLWFGRIVSVNDAQPLLGGTLTGSYWEFDVNVVPVPGTGSALLAAALLTTNRRRRWPSTRPRTPMFTRIH